MKKTHFIVISIFLFAFLSNLKAQNQTTDEVLSDGAICLKPTDEAVLKSNLKERSNNKSIIYWATSDPTIIELSEANNDSVKIKAIALGMCDITLFVDRRPIQSCRVIVDDDGIIKILAIGNSFSEDAVEQNLYEIINSEGIPVIIGNMGIGGCSFERHLQNVKSDAADYRYVKIIDGSKVTTEYVKISDALIDENWDFISLQQVSHFSGIYSTYAKDLPPFFEYLKEKNPKQETQYVLHQTWAYANDSKHDGFRHYSNDQQTMYKKIVESNNKAATLIGLKTIIPAGTAIQNGRSSFIGDNFNRDGFHLDLYLGRYTASCTWAKKLLGLNIITNPYIPRQLTMEEILIARTSAHNAVDAQKVLY